MLIIVSILRFENKISFIFLQVKSYCILLYLNRKAVRSIREDKLRQNDF